MSRKGNPVIGGLILLGLGTYFLLNQWFDLPGFENVGMFFLAGLGVVFLIAGVLRREAGLMIPGGILTGLGLGIGLVAGPFGYTNEMNSGALFMFAFAFGWLLITLFTAVFTDETQWWALIPGGIMALIGAGLMFEGQAESIFNLLAIIGPLVLIGLGLFVLFKGFRQDEKQVEALDVDELKALEK